MELKNYVIVFEAPYEADFDIQKFLKAMGETPGVSECNNFFAPNIYKLKADERIDTQVLVKILTSISPGQKYLLTGVEG